MLPTDVARRHEFLGWGAAPFEWWWQRGWARNPTSLCCCARPAAPATRASSQHRCFGPKALVVSGTGSSPHNQVPLNDRSTALLIGNVLRGGSSINALVRRRLT
jgi:hypothetical protein